MGYMVPDRNVPKDREPHGSHRMSRWRHGAFILPTGSDRYGEERKCLECHACEVFAGGAGSRWQDKLLAAPCEAALAVLAGEETKT